MAVTPEDPSAQPTLVERTIFATQKLGTLVLGQIETELAKIGLASRAFLVLANVAQSETVSQQDVSRLVSIDPTTMVALVDQLEGAGLIVRSRSTVDRRRYDLTVTRSGGDALVKAIGVIDAIEADFLAVLRPSELAAYRNASAKLLAAHWHPSP